MRKLLSLLVVGAALASASELRAQTATQEVPFVIKVPFTLQRLYPTVTEVQFSCMVYVEGTVTPTAVGVGQGMRMSVAELTKAPDGTLSGEASVAVTATVPTTTAGKLGRYRCLPYGCVNGTCKQLSPNVTPSDYTMAPTSGTIAQGTFTW